MLRINGIGDGMRGYVHPDKEVVDMYCERCKAETPFIKKLGKKRFFIYWIPLPSKERDSVYWECNHCNSFFYFEDESKNIIKTSGNNGGVMKKETPKEKEAWEQKQYMAVGKKLAEFYNEKDIEKEKRNQSPTSDKSNYRK